MREVYRKNQLQGFQSSKVESVAPSADGRRLFVGLSDGTIAYYECSRSGSSSNAYFDCNMVETVRRATRDKKAATSLRVVEAWNIIIGIVDTYIVAFDLHTFSPLNQIPETKGTTVYSINERASVLCVGQKHKLKVFSFLGGLSGFSLKKEISFAESPRVLFAVGSGGGSLIVGFKKHYEALDAHSYTAAKLLDFEREHKLVCVETPATSTRKQPAVILSTGTQGVLVDVFGSGVSSVERLDWFAPPLAACTSVPFVVSMLQDAVEIHDLGSLSSLQVIRFPSPHNPVCLSHIDSFGGGGGPQSALVASSDGVCVLTMIPLSVQVMRLVESGSFEDALSICATCRSYPGSTTSQLMDIDVKNIHERFGSVLFQKGDFDGAVVQYLAANSDVVDVLSLFPDVIPHQLLNVLFPDRTGNRESRLGGMTVSGGHQRLTGNILHRAAAAVVQYCEKMRPKVTEEANKAEGGRYAYGTTSTEGASSSKTGRAGDRSTSFAAAATGSAVDIDAADSAVKRSVLLDSVLVNALITSSSLSASRKQSVIEVLSGKNRCHIEFCAVLLASQGNSFTEALLWLYRSHGEHKRVLSALSEDRCTGSGASWTKPAFYAWTAEYLQWLWFSTHPGLPALVLPALKPVLEYDAAVGLSVLIGVGHNRKYGEGVIGGMGLEVGDVVAYLEVIENPGRGEIGSKAPEVTLPPSTHLRKTPSLSLGSGKALSLTYLEWVVGSGTASADIIEQYAQTLMAGVPLTATREHSKNTLSLSVADSAEMVQYKLYRQKLQALLESALPYRPERIMRHLPKELLHECALILSRMGNHEEVLMIYLHQLQAREAAEAYCHRVYSEQLRRDEEASKPFGSLGVGERSEGRDGRDVYLCLLKVQLALAAPSHSRAAVSTLDLDDETQRQPEAISQREALALALKTAEQYYDKLNPRRVMDILPPNAPLCLLQRFLKKSIEHSESRKRNLQVLHQLLRVHEVNLRTSDSPN